MQKTITRILVGTFTGTSFISLLTTCNYLQEKASRPNVILILTDDQGYGDFSVHGNPVLRAPSLDKLHS